VTISDRRRAANKANAAHSTGPRTPSGKARSAGNSLRHGLNVLSAAEAHDPEVELLAARFLIRDGDHPAAARGAAEAQSQLLRIRRFKAEALDRAISAVESQGSREPTMMQPDEIVALALVQAAGQLLTLDGYERKAVSRRKSALRAIAR
jgi:hypothetical protein